MPGCLPTRQTCGASNEGQALLNEYGNGGHASQDHGNDRLRLACQFDHDIFERRQQKACQQEYERECYSRQLDAAVSRCLHADLYPMPGLCRHAGSQTRVYPPGKRSQKRGRALHKFLDEAEPRMEFLLPEQPQEVVGRRSNARSVVQYDRYMVRKRMTIEYDALRSVEEDLQKCDCSDIY